MNIIILMAGKGERFLVAGIKTPKPLIKIHHKTMLELAIDSLGLKGNYIFVTRKYPEEHYNLEQNEILSKYSNAKIITTDILTEGPACSALLAQKYIDNEEELVITNCDQYMDWDANKFQQFIDSNKKTMDGAVVTYRSNKDCNSYIALDDHGYGTAVAEKKVISEYSLNGIHYWSKGSDFVSSTKEMIAANDRVRNEFYIAPTYNYLMKKNKKIKIFQLLDGQHHAIGIPEDLKLFLEKRIHEKI